MSFRTGLSRSALTPTARYLNIPNFVTAPHAKIFPHNPPDQKFHMELNDRPRVSLQKYLYITQILNGAFEKYCVKYN